ncbi:amidohydrolase family protein [Amycolatopsis jejuensis]|uniref:amidohydrolase family protein n=1 Tax=Amycolatopsis jejuensis TaxID=330084 RepID=UPI0005248EED|nr:amidohydrolase family protein [Amycolatopsis jejuensis]
MERQQLIDLHHHAIPADYVTALSEAGVKSSIPGVPFPAWTPEDSLALMEKGGIQAAILSIAPGMAGVRGEDARRIARMVNVYLAELVARYPARFGAFALLPLPDVDGAVREVEYALDELGLDGVGMYTNAGGLYLGDPRLEPLMSVLAERRVPVFVHPALPERGGVPHSLPGSVLEFPIETTRAVANVLFSGTLDRHPGLQLIFTHAGGAIPALAHRFALSSVIYPGLRENPSTDVLASLQRLHYDLAVSANPGQLHGLRELVDPLQMLFGSDFPFMPAELALENANGLRDYRGFTGDQFDQVARGSALDLFPRLRALLAD